MVEGNKIFAEMGWEVVTGVILEIDAKTGNLNIDCDQTECQELVTIDSGKITVVNEVVDDEDAA